MTDEGVIAVIPAKKKSQRLPDKNWREFLHGQSLTERKFLFAVGCGIFHHTILSVDFRDEIGFLSKPENQYAITHSRGWTVRRRPYFMLDDSAVVVEDALDHFGASADMTYCLLQPTSPHVMIDSVLKAVRMVQEQNVACVSVTDTYKPNGAIYAGKVGNLRKYHDFYRPEVVPLVLNEIESIDIDHFHDFEIARSVLKA